MSAQQSASGSDHKITCEFCDSLIDVRQNDVCPHCGAAFHNNKDYEEYTQHQEQLDEIRVKAAKELLGVVSKVQSGLSGSYRKPVKRRSRIVIIPFFLIRFLVLLIFLLLVAGALFFVDNFTDVELPFSLPKKPEAAVCSPALDEAKKPLVICGNVIQSHHPHSL